MPPTSFALSDETDDCEAKIVFDFTGPPQREMLRFATDSSEEDESSTLITSVVMAGFTRGKAGP